MTFNQLLKEHMFMRLIIYLAKTYLQSCLQKTTLNTMMDDSADNKDIANIKDMTLICTFEKVAHHVIYTLET